MDFGKLPDNEFPLVDFTLPADPELTKKVLGESQNPGKPDVYIGCAKWGRPEWKGMIYPPKTKEANFLDEYVKHFNSIELNAVFYRMPEKEQILKWREKAEKERLDFKFCPKFTQSITHIKRLKNAAEDTSKYLASISEFGPLLGTSFLQLSDNFGPKNFDILKAYLEDLPQDFDMCVEVRHKEWYSDAVARKDLFDMLYALKKGSAITDASGRRDCLHMELTTPQAFIRFVGNSLHATDFQRIDEWVARIDQWIKNGLKSVYFFLHQHDEKDTPILADYTIKKFNEVCGLSLKRPGIIDPSGLFDK